MDFVYSVARRVTMNGALAQDVTQSVFTQLARSAGALGRYDTLVGWLHTTARHFAINAVRGEERRRAREQESVTMQTNSTTTPEVNWEQIGPLLDEAVGGLREDDRKAVLLRFFKGLSHQEVGAELGLSEDTARKRVERALEKLREYFGRRGVTATASLLAAAMSENSVQAAPAGLAERTTETSLAGAGVAAESIFLKILLMSTKNKIILAAVILLMIAAAWLFHLHSPPEAVTATKANGEVVAPRNVAVMTKVPPIAGPVLKSGPAASASTSPIGTPPAESAADIQAELKNVIRDIARLERSGDLATLHETYSPPDELDPNQIQNERNMQADLASNNPSTGQEGKVVVQKIYEAGAQAYEALLDQTPKLNAAGDKATYKYWMPTDSDEEKGTFTGTGDYTTLVFVKINGKWYCIGDE
jgi:RNA polymerase sigma factor (sigma-70 family)